MVATSGSRSASRCGRVSHLACCIRRVHVQPHYRRRYGRVPHLACLLLMVAILASGHAARAADDAVDPASGLVIDTGWELTQAHCAGCHSAKLVTQNRLDQGGWEDIIRLMQAEHGLWDLGDAEPVIIDYLSRHYGAAQRAFRARRGRITQGQQGDITPP